MLVGGFWGFFVGFLVISPPHPPIANPSPDREQIRRGEWSSALTDPASPLLSRPMFLFLSVANYIFIKVNCSNELKESQQIPMGK